MKLREDLRDNLPCVRQSLKSAINDGDGKLRAAGLKLWIEYCVPKVKGHDWVDMTKSAKATLKDVQKLSVEEQAKKLLDMFYAGEISEYVLDVCSRAVSNSQHIKDEAVERLLAQRESANDVE
jgi:hypothetical protein